MAAVPFRVKAVYDYSSGHEDDLPFSVGQIITVTDDEDADWYGGEYVDDSGVKREGIFPRNFVEKYEPTAPPRPTRVRKKEPELAAAADVVAAAPPPLPSAAAPGSLSPADDPAEAQHDVSEATPTIAPRPSQVPAVPVASPPETASVPASAPIEPKVAPPASPPPAAQQFSPPVGAQPPLPQRAPAQVQPPAQTRTPPPVTAKPISNSFKDRIAAFNKPAAPPVAPFKPSGLGSGSSSGFIKKPFVAPPPSRNAYVPPPRDVPTAKVYRRDEDPEIRETQAESMEIAEKAGLVPGVSEEQEDDQPKPTSLKERIALLQKQQAEAAQRHADAVAKKEKPKRPPKKRTEGEATQEAGGPSEAVASHLPLERSDTGESAPKKSLDETRPARQSLSIRRKSASGPVENDGNEADMSGAGDTTEGQEDLTEKEDSDEKPRNAPPAPEPEGEEGEEEEEEEIDPEVRRKEELRARMAKMSGGMGMAGMFGLPGMMPMGGAQPIKKPKPAPPSERRSSELSERPSSPRAMAPPVPTMMALPGMGRPKQQEEAVGSRVHDEPVGEEITPVATSEQLSPATEPPNSPLGGAPPVPGGRPAPPPVPTESRPPPPPPPAGAKSPSVGSESDDELSENPQRALGMVPGEAPPAIPVAAAVAPKSPPQTGKRNSFGEGPPSSPPLSPSSKRSSRPPPPIPTGAPPPPTQNRPPPPPPPGIPSSRPSTADERSPPPMKPGALDNGEEGEVTEYEGDYDTDIASSVPHKDALKAHARDSSFDSTFVRSPATEVPSVPPRTPGTPAPATGPPPVPSQPPPNSRPSVDVPRAAPPPPPPAKEASYAYDNDDYDPYNYNAVQSPTTAATHSVTLPEEPTPVSEPGPSHQAPPPPPPDRRGPPPAPPSAAKSGLPSFRQSLDVQRPGGVGRRSVDVGRPSMETGFMANDVDLASHTQWWRSPNTLPPVFQGRKDIHFECDESPSTTADGQVLVTKEVCILFQDYSQTVITVLFDPQDPSNVELEQRHEVPPRTLRQDELEEAHERFGRQIATAVAAKKDSVVGDGTPNALIFELLRPLSGALMPVGTRAYGALVYANLANASTQLNDEIRPGDIISIRNAKFQGKHGPMHAKYTMEVGKPDHVAVVSEWDGTKKKVRAWEQGRESKKVKQESFKLDDLRSGEVKIWRVMPRSWIGWSSQD
ncbi:hypothetical protein F5X96DRAFT_669599 [Biscogniauxia mediterranea]|nr:hypothetical protein F5X96DRAFT_669599 [Biscogniauxia mediterranea]